MSIHAKDSTVTFTWIISPTASPPVKADFDINLINPNGTATYVDDGITTYIAPTATVQGEATYDLTLANVGLYKVSLSIGTDAVNIISAHREIYSVILPSVVTAGPSANIVRGPPPFHLTGTFWIEHTNPDNIDLNAVWYENGRWCVIGENEGGGDTYILTSDDSGDTWIERANAGLNQTYNDLIFAEGIWVAPGNADGTQTSIITSSDAETWTDRDTPNNNVKQQSIAYGEGRFVTVGHVFNLLNYTLWSDNGTTGWTIGDTSDDIGTGSMLGVAYGAGVFCAIGASAAMSSNDGKVWTDRISNIPAINQLIEDIIWDGTQFVAIGAGVVWTSPNGTFTWTALSLTGDYTGVGDEGLDIAYDGDGVYIICGKIAGVGKIWRSTDLLQWDIQVTDGNLLELKAVHFDGDLWVVVGSNQFVGDNDAALLTAS